MLALQAISLVVSESTGCIPGLEFSLTSASQGHSAIAAMLCSVLVPSFFITYANEEMRRQRRVMTVMPIAFVILLASSFFFSVLSGDTACRRSAFLGIFAGAMFGLGVALALSSIAWVIATFHPSGGVTPVVNRLVWVANFVIVFHVALTVVDAIIRAENEDGGGVVLPRAPIVNLLLLLSIALFFPLAVKLRRSSFGENLVELIENATIAFLGISVVLFGTFVAISAGDANWLLTLPWQLAAVAYLYTFAAITLLLVVDLPQRQEETAAHDRREEARS